MTKPIQIKYNCPEALSEMLETKCGFYCDMCKKEIYDFRGKSLVEIRAIQDKENVQCGVFDYHLAEQRSTSRIQSIFRIAFAAVFILGFNASMLFGQTKLNYPTNTDKVENVEGQEIVIKGKVFNHKKKRIQATFSYYFEQENYTFETNEKGEYEVHLPQRIFEKSDYFSVVVNAEGMETEYVQYQNGEGLLYNVNIYMRKYKESNHRHDILGFF